MLPFCQTAPCQQQMSVSRTSNQVRLESSRHFLIWKSVMTDKNKPDTPKENGAALAPCCFHGNHVGLHLTEELVIVLCKLLTCFHTKSTKSLFFTDILNFIIRGASLGAVCVS